MRLEVELVDGAGGGPANDLPPHPITPPHRRLDRFELSILFAFAAVSLWVVANDVWRVVFDGGVWTGTDGVYIVDQMQYLAWIKDASRHVLSSKLLVLRDRPAVCLNVDAMPKHNPATKHATSKRCWPATNATRPARMSAIA